MTTLVLWGRWWRAVLSCLSAVAGDRMVRRLTLALVAAVVALIGLHVFTMLSLRDLSAAEWRIEPDWLRLDRDRSLGEMVEYSATLAAALLVTTAWRTTRQPIYLALAVLFVVMVIDNAFMLHEWTAVILVDRGSLPGFLGEAHAHARGELVFHAVVGGTLAALVVVAFLRSGFRHKVHGLLLLTLVGAVLVFGIGVDYGQRLVGGPSWVGYALRIVEDGGELLTLVLLPALALGIVRLLPSGEPRATAGICCAPGLGACDALPVRTGPGRR